MCVSVQLKLHLPPCFFSTREMPSSQCSGTVTIARWRITITMRNPAHKSWMVQHEVPPRLLVFGHPRFSQQCSRRSVVWVSADQKSSVIFTACLSIFDVVTGIFEMDHEQNEKWLVKELLENFNGLKRSVSKLEVHGQEPKFFLFTLGTRDFWMHMHLSCLHSSALQNVYVWLCVLHVEFLGG